MGSNYLTVFGLPLNLLNLFFTIKSNMSKFIILLLCVTSIYAQSNCKVDSEVKFILNNFNPTAVRKNVDCVVDKGPCDSLGSRLKSEAGPAVRQGRCGKSCSCEQIQVRLVVNKLKREYPSQWSRVTSHYG